jgi:hypothetical protein
MDIFWGYTCIYLEIYACIRISFFLSFLDSFSLTLSLYIYTYSMYLCMYVLCTCTYMYLYLYVYIIYTQMFATTTPWFNGDFFKGEVEFMTIPNWWGTELSGFVNGSAPFHLSLDHQFLHQCGMASCGGSPLQVSLVSVQQGLMLLPDGVMFRCPQHGCRD